MTIDEMIEKLSRYGADKSYGGALCALMTDSANMLTHLNTRVRDMERNVGTAGNALAEVDRLQRELANRINHEEYLQAELHRMEDKHEADMQEMETTVGTLTKLVKKYKRRAKRKGEEAKVHYDNLTSVLDHNGKIIMLGDRLYTAAERYRANWLTEASGVPDDVSAFTDWADMRGFHTKAQDDRNK